MRPNATLQQLGTTRPYPFLIFHLKGLSSALTEVNTCCQAPDWAEGGGEMSTPLHVPICLSLFMIHVVEESKTRLGKKTHENTFIHVRRERTHGILDLLIIHLKTKMCSRPRFAFNIYISCIYLNIYIFISQQSGTANHFL